MTESDDPNYRPKTDLSPRTSNGLSINKLPDKGVVTSRTPENLFIDKEKEIDGVGMGVLSDGTPFLSGRGLARLCGVSSTRISEMAQAWATPSTNSMAESVKRSLRVRDVLPEHPYIAINQKGVAFHAYSDVVCIAVLEYYALDAESPTEQARNNFRVLAGKALHDFIYAQVGYDPAKHVPEIWRQFHDRISLTYNAVPASYFCVFKEISDIIVHLGQNGLPIDEKFVPDISVGSHWSKHWEKAALNSQYGDRQKFKHNYPEYFPQSASNPQPAWCYPEMALGEFKRWLREDYIKGGKFQNYLTDQVKKNALPPSFAQLAVAAYTYKDVPPGLPSPS